MSAAFADYFVKNRITAATIAGFARSDSVDLAGSHVWWQDGQPVGLLLHAARGAGARLACMGLVPSARRIGLGRRMVQSWIENCRGTGIRSFELEVIGANAPAIRLYQSLGFAVVQRLVGWQCAPQPGERAAGRCPPAQVDVRGMAARLAAVPPREPLPWQIANETVALHGPPWSAWALNAAHALVSDLSAPTVTVRALQFDPDAGLEAASDLLCALAAAHPGKAWRAPALFPEAWANAFRGAGWVATELDQLHMVLHL